MRCNYCGEEVFENAKFCQNCGAEVSKQDEGKFNETINQNVSSEQENVKKVNIDQKSDEKANVGLAILSFFIPLAGLIVFLTKKDKEPKTAKVSGICALVSFILNIIMIIAVFMFLSFAFNTSKEIIKEGGNTFDKIMDRADREIDDVMDDNDDNLNNASAWNDYEVVVNNKTIKLPCTYSELNEATGFKMKSAQESSSLSSNYYTLVNMYKNDKLALYTEILNDTNGDIKYTDGKITRIGQTKYQVSTGADQVIFPGGIKVGDKITEDEIVAKYGEPTDESDYSSNGYESDTYTYNADSNWKTTNYFEIKVVNGVIDEITLDNRNYK